MPKKVLIVDDEVFTLRLMEKKLTVKNCIVDSTTSGEDALELMDFNHYDLVILDVNLTGISGLDILKKIKNDKNALNYDTPFVMCSASVDYEIVTQAMANKAFDYIIKSFHLDKLNDIVDSIESYQRARTKMAV